MNRPGRVVAALLSGLLIGCAAKQERVILLPGPDGRVGVIEVRSAAGTVALTEAWSSARLAGKDARVEPLGEQEVARRYGRLLDGLPARPQQHILHFDFGTDRLTAQSRALLPGIRGELKQFAAPEVVVTGHTDAVGDATFNDKLSLDRANRMRDILVAAGIPAEQIQTVGRGAREPLEATRPGVPMPRNRRVEIKLR